MAYSKVIKKETVKALIRTSSETIEGTVYKQPNNRLLDTLNLQDNQFIAVSDAKVYSEGDGKLIYETDFIAVNKSHIVLITAGTVNQSG